MEATEDQLIDVKTVAEMVGASWRTVLRWADAGLMPWGVKVGGLRRWRKDEIQAWIKGGCKTIGRIFHEH